MTSTAIQLILVAVLGCCFVGSAVLSAAEVSIVRVRRSAVQCQVEDGVARAARLLALLDDLPVVLNTILLLALGLQVTAASSAGVLADRWLGRMGVTVASVVLTAVLFVYAEAIPKTHAVRSPEATALRLTPILLVVVASLRPVVRALVWVAKLHMRGSVTAQSALTEEEIRALASESADAGAIGEGDAEMVARSFEFNDRLVEEVMVPRSRIAAADADTPADEALDQAVALGHRRLLVRGLDLDDVLGVVRLRDLAAEVAAGRTSRVGSLTSAIVSSRPGEPISDLLRRMQAAGCWVAVVAGENGDTLGLATVEDLVAELVGEIDDDQPTMASGQASPPESTWTTPAVRRA